MFLGLRCDQSRLCWRAHSKVQVSQLVSIPVVILVVSKIFIELLSIGRPKHVRVMAGALEGDIFVGPKAEEHRGLLSISYPMEHGIVTDWNDMERIWSYIYSKVSYVESTNFNPF